MNEHVILEYIGGGKGLSTVLAYVGSFVGMCPFVLHSRAVVRKAAATVLASKRTFSGVLAHVAFKFGTGAKPISTDAVENLLYLITIKTNEYSYLLALELLVATMSPAVQIESHTS